VIVYNLICERSHKFEGWFNSKDDFDSQLVAEQIHCPVCDSSTLTLLPSGPRVNTRRASAKDSTPAPAEGASQIVATAKSAAAGKLLRWLAEQFENVGPDFAEEARSMHYGEKPHRNIRGQVAQGVAAELQEEGIEVVALPAGLDIPDKLN
jgi:hypothetical protein